MLSQLQTEPAEVSRCERTRTSLLVSSRSVPVRSEKAKQRLREQKWQNLRDEAIRNKAGTTPLPASLLDDVVPRGTYNPMQEQYDLEEASFNDMEDDHGALLPQHPSGIHEHDIEAGQPMESEDGHSDLVSVDGGCENRAVSC